MRCWCSRLHRKWFENEWSPTRAFLCWVLRFSSSLTVHPPPSCSSSASHLTPPPLQPLISVCLFSLFSLCFRFVYRSHVCVFFCVSTCVCVCVRLSNQSGAAVSSACRGCAQNTLTHAHTYRNNLQLWDLQSNSCGFNLVMKSHPQIWLFHQQTVGTGGSFRTKSPTVPWPKKIVWGQKNSSVEASSLWHFSANVMGV